MSHTVVGWSVGNGPTVCIYIAGITKGKVYAIYKEVAAHLFNYPLDLPQVF